MSRPNPRRRARRLVLAALGLTVVLGACGGSNASGSADGETTKTTKADRDPSSGTDGTGTPLEQLFSDTNASQGAMEDAIAACMRDRGWQYTPNRATFTSGVAIGGNGDAKFREQYGYGISTQPPPDAFGIPTDGEQPKDPNASYRESLSDADKARYEKDLFGAILAPPEGSDNTGGAIAIDSTSMDPNACVAKAQAEVAKTHPEMSQEFGKRLGELAGKMDDDPRMQDAVQKWSACMAEANFTYTKVEEIFTDLSARANKLLGNAGPGGGIVPTDGASGGVLVSGASGAGAAPASTTPLSASDQAALTKLQDEERAIAKADAACQKTTIDKVRPDLEQEIVEKLRSEFPGIGSGK